VLSFDFSVRFDSSTIGFCIQHLETNTELIIEMSQHDKPEICPFCQATLPERKLNMCGIVVQTVRSRPDLSYAEIAKIYHIERTTVWRYAKRAGIRRRKGRKQAAINLQP